MTDPEQTLAADLIALRDANPPDAAFAADLEARLHTVIANRAAAPVLRDGWHRRIAALAAALALVLLLFLTVPALRAFAQDLIRQIGGILLTDAPSPGEQTAEDIRQAASTPALFRDEAASAPPNDLEPATVAQINALAGFDLYEPSPIASRPPFTFQAEALAWRSDSVLVILHYLWFGNPVALVETRADDPALAPIWNQAGGDAVTVRGGSGRWFRAFALDDPRYQAQAAQFQFTTGGTVKSIKLLAWREGDRAFVLQSPSFTLDLLQELAASLAPVADTSRPLSWWSIASAADLAATSDYTPYAPDALPDDFYLMERYAAPVNGVKTIVSDYRLLVPGWFLDFYTSTGEQLVLSQIASTDLQSLGLGDAPLVDVTIQGQPGVWIEQWAVSAWYVWPDQARYERANTLIWESGGYTFLLQNLGGLAITEEPRESSGAVLTYAQQPPHLTLADMVRVADSVTAPR